MKERDTHVKKQGKRFLESGQLVDVINVEFFLKRDRTSNDGPFKVVRTREEVDIQWARASVSVGLPMSFFDNKEVRKTVLMTTECAENYIRTNQGVCQGAGTRRQGHVLQ